MNATLPPTLAVCLLLPLGAAAQQGPVEGLVASPALARLATDIAGGAYAAEEGFWEGVMANGSPLVEPVPDAPGHSVVTFLFRGDATVRGVRLDSHVNALLMSTSALRWDDLGRLTRLDGTGVWHLTFRLRNDLRIPYRFEVDRGESESERVLDPLNPLVWEAEEPALAASVLELPGAPPQPWRGAGAEAGEWDQWRFDEPPDSGRTVYIYKPAGWSAERPESYPVLVGLGAYGHGIGMRADWLVDHLVADGRLPPVVLALADLEVESERTRYQATTDFVADRLLPVLRVHYNVSADPADVIVSGTSRRGLVAAVIAFRRPDAAGNVLSLSGSYYWRPNGAREYEWITGLYASSPRRPVRFYIAAGELETVVSPANAGHYMVATNRHFRDVLRAVGYPVTYVEFNGVHSELSWQDRLAEGLERLLSADPAR